MKEKIRLGVVPVKRGFLSMEEALRQKNLFMKVIRGIRPDAVTIVDIDDLCENGILFETSCVDSVIAKLKKHNVDALFVPFCDFGEEVVVARVTAALKLPVLVWGARDERPNTDASRGRDTQCGIFASTKAMARFGVTYSYIYNVSSETDEFKNGFEMFIRTVNVVKSLKGLRVAQIGQRPANFMSVISGEAALMEKFGIEVVPLSVRSIAQRMEEIKRDKPCDVNASIETIKTKVDVSRMTDENICSMAAFKIALKESISVLGCKGAALECWSALRPYLNCMPCFINGELTDEGLPISCETDVNGIVTSIMMEAVTLGDSSTFFADLTIRHPENDNAELLWHCGPFPYSLRNTEAKPYLDQDGRGRFLLKKGDITIARFDDINGNYNLISAEGRAVDGPPTTGTYVYFETDNWKRVEEKFVFGPYIHHVVGGYGKYARCLKEAVRFIKNLEWDDLSAGPTAL